MPCSNADLNLSLSRGGGPILAVGFYLTLMAMIPLSLGPDQAVLTRIAAGLTWLCLALSTLLSLERLFERCRADCLVPPQLPDARYCGMYQNTTFDCLK